ncbi:MAG: zinc-dependent metalloprotease [Phycisphaerales bacterium]|nr:zinc-dependent metalloprotease [Phycisphaerales bacterium]
MSEAWKVRGFGVSAAALALSAGLSAGVTGWVAGGASAQPAPGQAPAGGPEKPDYPPFNEVAKGFDRVQPREGDGDGLWTLFVRQKDGHALAELPRAFANQKYFIAMTISTGSIWAGLQGGDLYVYWRQYDRRLALVSPQIDTRSTGDQESKDSVERHFTDRVLLDMPILTTGPGGGPVIDLDDLLLGRADVFFGGEARGINRGLVKIKEVKVFPQNVVIAFEVPAAGGQLKTFHYSISLIPENTGYKPRVADERVGFFTTVYRDLGKFRDDEKWVRFVNRWNIEKADPKLKLSPPKQPIVFYIEHTVPIRYRRFVRDGVLYWNKAFEKIGISEAIEVRFQDKASGAHMDKDPEDVRYNFIRWLSNDIGTAIGPSRVHPLTGQILDADVVLTDGWIRHFWYQANEVLPELAMQDFTPQTLAWLSTNPGWDPRVRLAEPGERERILIERQMQRRAMAAPQRGLARFGASPTALDPATADAASNPFALPDHLRGLCMAAKGKGMSLAVARMHFELEGLIGDEAWAAQDGGAGGGDEGKGDEKKDDKKDEKKKDDKPKPDLLDGIPDWFIGPMLADLTAHEVGHTLGLRHNFKASSVYTMAQINSDELKGKKPWAGSVMDYNPVNINMDPKLVQGDYGPSDIGPYDLWAIEYGYGFGDPKETLKRVADPMLAFGTDEDTTGPDPLVRMYDLSADPMDYARNQIALAKYHRERLLGKFVKDGQSWARTRRGYNITLGQHVGAVNMMARWVGGSFVNRDRKGDPNGRPPIVPVPVAQQRAALDFVIQQTFFDEAFGLTPELLKYMTVDKWWDGGGMGEIRSDQTFPIHERILGIQASALTMLMNPTTLGRVFDNEWRSAGQEDMLTLPELFDTVYKNIWGELDKAGERTASVRQPLISSLRRNLQHEHVNRLIDLTMPDGFFGAAAKPVGNLAVMQLRKLKDQIGGVLDKNSGKLDPYSLSHLSEAKLRIEKALDAQYIYNANQIGGGFGGFMFFGEQPGRAGEAPAPQMPAPNRPAGGDYSAPSGD